MIPNALAPFASYVTVSFLVSAVGGFAGAYLTSYLRKKGEDRAVEESLAKFTKVAEEIKHHYAMVTEQFRADQTHRFVASEKRFDALQQAFVQWRRVFDAIGDRTALASVVQEARQWWNANCLYLDDQARQAFNHGMSAVLIWAGREMSDEESERQWKIFFFGVPEAIFKSAKMPPLAKDELPAEPLQRLRSEGL